MPPQSSFGEVPRKIQRDEGGTPEDVASNDAVFGKEKEKSLEELTMDELFQKRRSHEITLRLGYRNASVDETILQRICEHMKVRGIDETEYKQFLRNRATAE